MQKFLLRLVLDSDTLINLPILINQSKNKMFLTNFVFTVFFEFNFCKKGRERSDYIPKKAFQLAGWQKNYFFFGLWWTNSCSYCCVVISQTELYHRYANKMKMGKHWGDGLFKFSMLYSSDFKLKSSCGPHSTFLLVTTNSHCHQKRTI